MERILPCFAELFSTYCFPNRLYIFAIIFLFEAIQKDNNFSSIIAKLEHHGKNLRLAIAASVGL